MSNTYYFPLDLLPADAAPNPLACFSAPEASDLPAKLEWVLRDIYGSLPEAKRTLLNRRFHNATNPVPYRPMQLRNEVLKLHAAASFLTWRYGQTFNLHMTITPSAMFITDPQEFVRLLPLFQKEVGRWLRQGRGMTRQRATERAKLPGGLDHYWIWALENCKSHGLHAHILMVLPGIMQRAFEKKARAWWRDQAMLSELPTNALYFSRSYGANERTKQAAAWQAFRYIIKSADREAVASDEGMIFWTLQDVFHPDAGAPGVPARVTQLYGISENLSQGAQAAAGFESAFKTGTFRQIYSGWEWEAFHRRAADEERAKLLRQLNVSDFGVISTC